MEFKSIRRMPNRGQTTTKHLIKFHNSYNLTQVYKYAREHLAHDNDITIMFGKHQDVPNNHNNNDTRCYKLQYMYMRENATRYNVTNQLRPSRHPDLPSIFA